VSEPIRRSFVFWIGVWLIAVSFSLYLLYPLLAMLAIARETKLAIGAAGWVVSWSMFFVGSTLAGAEGLEMLKSLFRRRSPPPAEKGPDPFSG
jgi:hypothetical protein